VAVALALLSSVLWGAADFLGGTVTRRLPVVVVVLLSQAVALLCLAPLPLALGASPGGVLAPVVGVGVGAGVLGPLALLAFYRALATGTMGIVAPVSALGVGVPVVAGLATGESPSAAQLAGIAVAVVGVVLACGPELRGNGRGGAAPLLLALVAALGFGGVFVLLAEGSGEAGDGPAAVLAVLLVMRTTSVLLLTVLLTVVLAVGAAAVRESVAGTRPDVVRALPLLAVLGVFDVAANGAYAVATQTGLVSVSAVLASLYPVVTGLLAWRLHGERLAGVQWGGVALAMTGVVLLAAG
jgi:drug/metabolite transporter (DMT)-like permease